MNLRRFIQNCCTVFNQSTVALEEDDVYRILSSRRRRLLLLVLDDREDDQVAIAELARAVAARDIDAEPLGVPEDLYDATYVSLYQSHLPVLTDTDVIEWDRDAGLVRANPPTSGLADDLTHRSHLS